MERVIQRLTRHLPETDRKLERITVITADFRLQEMPVQEAAKEILGLADMFKQHLSERRATNLGARR